MQHELVAAALDISERRRETLRHMKEAIEKGDKEEVFEFAKALCGVENEQTSDRISESVN
jgi:hypothetical protein